MELALPIWLLAKKHRVYEQRSHLRALQIKSLLEEGKVPLWSIRWDHETKPPYIENSPEMIDIAHKQAKAVAEQAYIELICRETADRQSAERYLQITRSIYEENDDEDSDKAEARLLQTITKYRNQEYNKLEAAREKDFDAFPKDDME